MAAGATRSQKSGKRYRFLNRVQYIAEKSGHECERPRGGPLAMTSKGFKASFDMVFDNMSNGETVIQCLVTLTRCSDGKAHTFNNWSWTGDTANHGLRWFWQVILNGSVRGKWIPMLALIDAFNQREAAAQQ